MYPVMFGENAGKVVGEGVSTLEDWTSVNLAAALWPTADDQGLLVSNRGEERLCTMRSLLWKKGCI